MPYIEYAVKCISYLSRVIHLLPRMLAVVYCELDLSGLQAHIFQRVTGIARITHE